MNFEEKPKRASTHRIDHQSLLDQTAADLRSQNFSGLDLENLVTAIENLSQSNKRMMAGQLTRLCEHLLKVQYWHTERGRCFKAWHMDVTNIRLKIKTILKDHPSTKDYLSHIFASEYGSGRQRFLQIRREDKTKVPESPCFTLEQALDEDWLPWQPE